MSISARALALNAGFALSSFTLATAAALAAPTLGPGGIPPGGGSPGPTGQGPSGAGDIRTFAPPIFVEEGGGGPTTFDFGDAPDGGTLCGRFGGIGFFPTVPGSPNANRGALRDAPFHNPVPLNAAVNLGRNISFELSAAQPACDWLTAGCDSFGDDGALVLCFDDKCASGITLGNGVCGSGFGSYFGPRPAPNTSAFWVLYTVRGANSIVPTVVNVLTDADQSGAFDDNPDAWCLQDESVELVAGGIQFHQTAPFAAGNLIYSYPSGRWAVDAFWNRFIVSDEEVLTFFPVSWDGSGKVGGYAGGETEDWLVQSVEAEYTCRLPEHAFESTAIITINLNPADASCAAGTDVSVTSTDQPIGMMREFRNTSYRALRAIPLEVSQLTLAGTSAEFGGNVIVRERSDKLSMGVIDEVASGAGLFLGGKARFDYWFEIELEGTGQILNTGPTPLRLDAGPIITIPPIGVLYNTPPLALRTKLYDSTTGVHVGWVCIKNFMQTQSVPAICPGDTNHDREVNFDDIAAILASWGSGGPTGDATRDCVVDFIDVTSVLVNWGANCR